MVIRYPWDSTKYTPFQTGIPPHVMLLSEIEAMKNRMSQLNSKLLTIDESLNVDNKARLLLDS